ncbi:MAG: hypothetical protein A2513_06285 [Sulfurimonas sp. RIFOXYD12_FULL_33_39]|uniref:PP0621 family protein n=1 Tax=unclassified Sulfurimonas TaxID=2623549 RepID=UPI0008B61D11|nr:MULTISPECIES: PP0621 family protein [unclassified Sulfurimonas]OHE06636.1 MAG: hypothetical protein A3G74_04760 [Sulfurimonas sp. RIFCSPLOWO2_12_FULL_34_6]OHE10463.1 MAG: hypothetical protein A2513_06285 [Sulfurimonas sp. RIFOXYD12_FULL_33_39]OHE14922.1 MAG: hypothetical protein A2530_00475 [Sulfurimonas sp. RIFOXYD2_FULL_34_21]DAB27806.1 MAG TPA: hypothetical protein CFH78_05720 [Sulfurimonas sp. UBA10385]
MILKLLLVIGVIAVVYFIFIKKKPSDKISKNEEQSSEMVECATCKVYCELDDAILSGSKYYCSKECLEKVK